MKFSLKLVILMLTSLLSFHVAAESKQLSEAEINAQMQKMADNINKQLPRKVDEIMTLLHVSYDNKIFSYFYKIDDMSQLKDTGNVEKNMVRITCSTLGKMVKEQGYSYHYNYVAPNNEQIIDFTVNKDSCAETK